MCNCGSSGNGFPTNFFGNNHSYHSKSKHHKKSKSKKCCGKCCKYPKGSFVKNVFFTSSTLSQAPLYPSTLLTRIR